MAQWNKNDAASNSVNWLASSLSVASGNANNASNNTSLFNNTTPSAFLGIGKAAVGQFGVSVSEAANTSGEGKKVAHAGWNLRTNFTGPLTSLTVTAGGTGYNNTDVVTVSGGVVNATASLTTNSTGGIVSVTPSVYGNGFMSVSTAIVAVANSTGGSTAGSGATLTPVLGGRANRVQYETLVAMRTITGDASDDSYLPES